MIDADLLVLIYAARLADNLADELLIHGTTFEEMCEGNDLLNQRDEALRLAATAVMETGCPGGSPSQHDADCALACSCGPAFVLSWCRRHEGMWLDPETRPTLRAGGCERLPGCGWPSAGGGPV